MKDGDSTTSPLPSDYRVKPTPLRTDSVSSQDSRVSSFGFNTPAEDSVATTSPLSSFCEIDTSPSKMNSGSSEHSNDVTFSFNIPMKKSSATIPLSPTSKLSTSSNEKSSSRIPKLAPYIFKGSSLSDDKENSTTANAVPFTFKPPAFSDKKGYSRIPKPVPFTFNASTYSGDKDSSRIPKPVAFTVNKSTFSDEKENIGMPIQIPFTFRGSDSSDAKGNSRIPKPAPFIFKGSSSSDKKVDIGIWNPAPFTFRLSATSSDVKSHSRIPKPIPFIFKGLSSTDKKETQGISNAAPFTFRPSAASSDVKSHSRIPKPVPFIFKGSSSADKKNPGTPNAVPFTFRPSAASSDVKSHSRIPKPVPFAFKEISSSVKNENPGIPYPVPFTFRPSASSDTNNNSRIIKPVPFSSKSSSSPDEKDNSRASNSAPFTFLRQVPSLFKSSIPSNQASLDPQPDSSSHASTSASAHSSLSSKRKHDMITYGIPTSALRSPSNMCALRRDRTSQYLAVRLTKLADDKSKPVEIHTAKRRRSSAGDEKHPDSSRDISTSVSLHSPPSLKRKHEMIFDKQPVGAIELKSYLSNLQHTEISQSSTVHPTSSTHNDSLDEASHTPKRQRGSSDEQKKLECDDESTARKSTFAQSNPDCVSNDRPGHSPSSGNSLSSVIDSEQSYAGSKRKERDHDDFVPAFKRLRTLVLYSKRTQADEGDGLTSPSEDLRYIERTPTTDQNLWLPKKATSKQGEAITIEIRDNTDRQDEITSTTLDAQHDDEAIQQVHDKINVYNHRGNSNKTLVKRDSGYHECTDQRNEMKSLAKSTNHIDGGYRTPSPDIRPKITPPPSNLEIRTISTVEDLFEELEDDERIERNIYKEPICEENDGSELVYVHREFKVKTGIILTEHRWALDDSSSSDEEASLCQTWSKPRALFPWAKHDRKLDETTKEDEIDEFFM
ncbi:hypothetical protein BGW37DRAFT_488213 [Umbelopsis sp. PMI_123]|nr:hypothetical protein BGW37DRAFT_488213 [Umbelopsis sp. PMI_123]